MRPILFIAVIIDNGNVFMKRLLILMHENNKYRVGTGVGISEIGELTITTKNKANENSKKSTKNCV